MIYKFLKNCEVTNPFFEKRMIYETDKPEKGVGLHAIRDTMNLPYAKQETREDLDGLKAKVPKSNPDTNKPPVAPKKGKDDENKDGRADRAEKATVKPRRLRRRIARPTEDIKKKDVKEEPADVSKGIENARKRIENQLGKEKLQPYIDNLKAAIEKKENSEKLHKFIEDRNTFSGNSEEWNKDFCDTFSLNLKEDEPEDQDHMRYAAALQIYLAEYFVKQNKGDVFQTLKGKKANPFIFIDGKLGGYTISALAAYWNDKYFNDKSILKKLDYAKLEEEYGNNKKNKEIFGKAIDYLKGQLSGQPAGANPPPAPGQSLTAALAAAPGTTAAKSSSDFVGPPEPPTAKKSEESKADKEKKDREWNEAVDRIQKSEKLRKNADTFTSSVLMEQKTSRGIDIKRFSETQFGKLRDEYNRDPNEIGFTSVYRNDYYRGSWPREIFKRYKDAYENAKKNSSPENEKRRDDLYQMLSKSASDYNDFTKKIVERLKSKYEPALRVLIGTYSLPDGVDIGYLSPTTTEMGFSQWSQGRIVETIQNKKQRELIKPTELQNPSKIDEFYAKYFKEPPKRTVESWDVLAKLLKSPTELKNYFAGISDEGIKDRVNNIILFKNMHTVYWRSEWYKREFNKELDSAVAALDSNFENYYKDYKDKKDKDFVADLMQGGKFNKRTV